MCGICGALNTDATVADLKVATSLILHRGPDEEGLYCKDGVALGMRRLSIIDLAGGTQPKTNETGTIQVIFNGEIYNFRELQEQLRAAGHVFESHSDTEVIVHAYEEWGVESFRRLNGIFAIALWDIAEDELILARDHLGVKPLYYASRGRQLVFGSELKPVLALLPEMPAIDRVSTRLFLRYQYVPAPRSIFQGVQKLPPAHFLRVSRSSGECRLSRYWDPIEIASTRRTDLTGQDAEDAVDASLTAAVKRQLVSDVPLGAFLSGGIDSSLVVALMRRGSQSVTKTFSIGFEYEAEDESQFAEQVARHLGTEHHSWTITESDALDVVPKLPQFFDEPFADPSAVPTYLVSQLARRHVTVSLSGDGGDELFGGYTRYAELARIRRWWSLPAGLRRAGLDAGRRLPGRAGSRFRRGSSVIRANSRSDAYRNMIAVTGDEALSIITDFGNEAYSANPEWPSQLFEEKGLNEAMMLTDLITYLPDDILTKVDRASMAHSLEARVPVLDPTFVELALTLPTDVRMSRGPKSLLKDVLKRYVPAELVDRPKHGFGIPIHDWLRGDLRECLLDYVTDEALCEHGLMSARGVNHMVQEHMRGDRNRGYTLWAILMFQIWYDKLYREFASAQSRRPAAVS